MNRLIEAAEAAAGALDNCAETAPSLKPILKKEIRDARRTSGCPAKAKKSDTPVSDLMHSHLARNRLIRKYGAWGEHPDYPRSDWHYAVTSGETNMGYWDLVAARLEERDDQQESNLADKDTNQELNHR